MTHVTKPVLVQVRVARRERSRWAEAAAREDLTLSELVREAVRGRLAGVVRVVEAVRPDNLTPTSEGHRTAR
jgi:hypothetical protein